MSRTFHPLFFTRVRMFRLATGAASVIGVLIFWYVGAAWHWLPERFVPHPKGVWSAFVHLLAGSELWLNLAGTMQSSALGLLVGILVGVPLGLMMATSPMVDSFISPLIRCTYSLPKTTLIPLLVLWLGVGIMTNIAVISITAMLPLVMYTFRGVREAPQVLSWSALSLGASRATLPWRVLLPTAAPYILTGTRVALGLTLLVAISCEMVVSNRGIGKLVLQYGEQGIYDYLFAALFATTVIAYLADAGLCWLTRRLLSWHETSA
jgi:ABC-type nitrate/sulfonate/bicarbonate transport system permease component